MALPGISIARPNRPSVPGRIAGQGGDAPLRACIVLAPVHA